MVPLYPFLSEYGIALPNVLVSMVGQPGRIKNNSPLLSTARHSSSDLLSGKDILLDEDEEPLKRALRNGIDGIEARKAVDRMRLGYRVATRGRVKLEMVYRRVEKNGENRMSGRFLNSRFG
jgi:hypothetical protein